MSGRKRESTSERKKGTIIWVPKALMRALMHILSFDLLFSLILHVKNDQGYLSTFCYPVFRDQHTFRIPCGTKFLRVLVFVIFVFFFRDPQK